MARKSFRMPNSLEFRAAAQSGCSTAVAGFSFGIFSFASCDKSMKLRWHNPLAARRRGLVFSSLASALLLLCFLLLRGCLTVTAAGMHVSDGFEVEKIAAAPQILFPMFAALDDRGRLFVAESSGLDLYAELQNLTR